MLYAVHYFYSCILVAVCVRVVWMLCGMVFYNISVVDTYCDVLSVFTSVLLI